MAAVTSSTSSSNKPIMTVSSNDDGQTVKPLIIKVKGLRKNKENRKVTAEYL